MASDITLAAATRQHLSSLSNTANLMQQTQQRLSTSIKGTSAVDGAILHLQTKSLLSRADDLTAQKAAVTEGISTVKSALDSADSVYSLLKQATGLIGSAQEIMKNGTFDEATQSIKMNEVDQAAIARIQKRYHDLLGQINAAVGDAAYHGVNLLAKDRLEVHYGAGEKNSLTVEGADLSTEGLDLQSFNDTAGASTENTLGNLSSATVDVKGNVYTGADTASAQLDTAMNTVRTVAAQFGGNSAHLQTRLDFTTQYINTVQESSALKFDMMDMSFEGANLVALQTRQQIAVQSLAIAGQQQQAVLQLLR